MQVTFAPGAHVRVATPAKVLVFVSVKSPVSLPLVLRVTVVVPAGPVRDVLKVASGLTRPDAVGNPLPDSWVGED